MAIIIWMLISCDHNTSIPFDFPEYKPHLIIQAVAGTQSGAYAFIGYNRPLKEQSVNVTELPPVQVYLLENGKEYLKFWEDSIGVFRIHGEELDLKYGVPYSLEVTDMTSGEKYISGVSYLPPKPIINDIVAFPDTNYSQDYYLKISLAPNSHPVFAISAYNRFVHDSGAFITPYSIRNQLNANIQYPEQSTWVQNFDILIHDRRSFEVQDTFYNAKEALLHVSYLSEDLSRFIREAEEQSYFGENIFQIVNPIHSNISGGLGIFGLYNEDTMRIKIE